MDKALRHYHVLKRARTGRAWFQEKVQYANRMSAQRQIERAWVRIEGELVEVKMGTVLQCDGECTAPIWD